MNMEPGMVAAGDQERAEVVTAAMSIASYFLALKAGGLPEVLVGELTASYADYYWQSHFGLGSCGCG